LPKAGLPAVLAEAEILEALTPRSPWILEDGRLVLRLSPTSFAEVDRMVRAILTIAQTLDHHPDVCFGYNHLTVTLFTHDVQGITQKDLACADQILQQHAS
jgi:4a-hydroxytetrahydrobiopterin dehydratase